MAFVLSESDARLLRSLLEREKRRIQNTQGRTLLPEMGHQAPEMVVVRTPSAIAGITEEPGTGSDDNNDEVQYVECEIYQVEEDETTQDRTLNRTFAELELHNLSDQAVAANSWRFALRDKFGTWWSVPVGSSDALTGRFVRLTTSSDNGGAWSPARWKYVKLTLSSGGVYIDDGGESASFNAVPLTVDGTNYANPVAGQRVWLWDSATSGFYEFQPNGYASVLYPGLVSIAAQTFNGVKTFDDQIVVNDGQANNTSVDAVKIRGNDDNGVTGGAYDLMVVASVPYNTGGTPRSGSIRIGVDNGGTPASPPTKRVDVQLAGNLVQYGSQEIYAYDSGGVNSGLVRIGSTAAGFGIEIESSVDGANVYLTTTTLKATAYEPTLWVDDGIYADGFITSASGYRIGSTAGASGTDAIGNVFNSGIITTVLTSAATALTNLGIGGGLSNTYNIPGAAVSGDLQTMTFTNGVLTGVTFVP